MKKISGHFIASTAAVKVDVGFAPDKVRCIGAVGGTEVELEWERTLYDDLASGSGLYGFTHDTSGVPHPTSGADDGIIPYEDSTEIVLISDPGDDTKKVECSVSDWDATSTNPTQRSATAPGTIVRPPVHNGCVYECTTQQTASYTSEPANWPTVPGETCTDGGSIVWTCRMEEVARGGGIGFELGVNLTTDGHVWYFEAEQHDRYGDFGDHDVTSPVTYLS